MARVNMLRQARKLLNLNLLLVFAPLGFLASAYHWAPVAVFAFNFLAIIPLSGLISDASDTLSERWGGLVGGLVNASLGNTVELIVRNVLPVPKNCVSSVTNYCLCFQVGIMAITQNNMSVAQSAMMGSILNDILLVHNQFI